MGYQFKRHNHKLCCCEIKPAGQVTSKLKLVSLIKKIAFRCQSPLQHKKSGFDKQSLLTHSSITV